MKKSALLIALAVFMTASIAFCQTMKVQTKNGDKPYSVSDVQSISFGKTTSSTIEMVEIPTGTFKMGQVNVATPVRNINIKRAFYMGKYEVTQKQYLDVIESNPSNFGGNDDNPVEMVSWNEAVEFCNALSRKEGLEECYTLESGTTWRCNFNKKGYRLPTEAEWEYACRANAPTNTDYYTGNGENALAKAGWYYYNSNSTTNPVGQKEANKFGLYDMHGNVWEWCWDWYAAAYAGDNLDDPPGPNSGSYRVFRGGGWNYGAIYCRSAYRYTFTPDYRDDGIGFRIARTK
jgi:formylglycine-generating enzyme required for sulfatase activity